MKEKKKPLVSEEEAMAIFEENVQDIVPQTSVKQGLTMQNVRTEAVHRLASLVEKATNSLEDILDDEDASASTKLKAIQTVYSYAIGRPHEAKFVDDINTQASSEKVQRVIELVKDDAVLEEAIDDAFYGGGRQ